MSESRKGRVGGMLGKKHSKESIEKRTKSREGCVHSEETKEKIRQKALTRNKK